jgi:hypothetical protein
MNLKEKIHLNKKITNLTIENNNRNSYFFNNNDSNTFNNNTKLSIKKKKPQVIKIKTETSLESGLKAYNTEREQKYSTLNYNYNGYIYYNNKSGNNTTSHILNYTKKRIQKPNSRNYVSGFESKNTFSYLNSNLNNGMNSFGNNNNCVQTFSSLNTQSNIKPKTKKILKIKTDCRKDLNNNNNSANSNNKLGNKTNFNTILNDNNNTLKIKGEFNNITVKPYKKVSPYMKPECRSLNILKVKTCLNKKINTKISNSIKPKNKISNIRINWNSKDNKEKSINNQKMKFNFQCVKENFRTITQNKK